MTIRRDVVCGICGLVACVCANAGTVSEGAHPHQRESRKVEALPPEQDHTHQDFDRAVRIEDVVKYAVAPPIATLPPGQQMMDAPWVTRRGQGRHPAYDFPPPQIAPLYAGTQDIEKIMAGFAVKGQYDETGEKLVKQADEHVTAS